MCSVCSAKWGQRRRRREKEKKGMQASERFSLRLLNMSTAIVCSREAGGERPRGPRPLGCGASMSNDEQQLAKTEHLFTPKHVMRRARKRTQKHASVHAAHSSTYGNISTSVLLPWLAKSSAHSVEGRQRPSTRDARTQAHVHPRHAVLGGPFGKHLFCRPAAGRLITASTVTQRRARGCENATYKQTATGNMEEAAGGGGSWRGGEKEKQTKKTITGPG